MKKLVTSLALAAMAYTGAQGGVPNLKLIEKALNPSKKLNPLTMTKFVTSTDGALTEKAETPQASFRTVFSTDLWPSTSVLASYSNSMIQDPETGLTMIAAAELKQNFIGTVVHFSSNGTQWTRRALTTTGTTYLLQPNLGANKVGAKTYEDLDLAVTGLVLEVVNNQLSATGETQGYFKTLGDVIDAKVDRPSNKKNYQFSGGPLVSFVSNNDFRGVAFAGTLNPDPNTQYGLYGNWSFDLAGGDFLVSTVSKEWELDKFTGPNDPTINTSFNSTMNLVSDPSGVLYSWVCNFFPEDNQTRLPAFSMSEDGGESWSKFNVMPSNLLTEYATANGAERLVITDPYSQHGAVATGDGKTSYYIAVTLISGEGNNAVINSIDLAEVSYSGSTWAMKKVTTLNNNLTDQPAIIPFMINRADTVAVLKGTNLYAYYDDNFLGFEIQATRTPDGKNVAVKWLNNNYTREFTVPGNGLPAMTIVNNQFVDDTIRRGWRTDVYMAYKQDGNNEWTIRNVTDDNADQKGTKIPPVILDLKKVPLLTCKNRSAASNNDYDAIIPAALKERSYYNWVDASVASIDLLDNSSVNDNETVSTSQFSLSAPIPNPTADNFSFSFTAQKSGNATISISDALGRTVATLFDGNLEQGTYARNVDASQFAPGIYYISLTLEGQTLTKAVSIVR